MMNQNSAACLGNLLKIDTSINSTKLVDQIQFFCYLGEFVAKVLNWRYSDQTNMHAKFENPAINLIVILIIIAKK